MDTRTPDATYRLQLGERFGFNEVLALVGYFKELGVTDLYLSPIYTASPGSPHGYDVTDHSRINPELGSEEEFANLARHLHDHGMGVILDVVPNHMFILTQTNRFWYDVLENGPSSRFANYFDIDWNPPKSDLTAKVLLPFLGDQYGRVLEAGEIRIAYQDGLFGASYYDLKLPVAPRSWPHILEPSLLTLRQELGEDTAEVLELESIITALAHLPSRTEANRAKVRERYREKEIIKRRLMALCEMSAAVDAAVHRSVEEINGRKGDPRSFDRLELLLADQGYRLCYWQVAADEINYRRFFDINELAAICVEVPTVFSAVHHIIFRLARERLIDGLRIDHIDGLLNPAQYLLDLGQGFAAAQREAEQQIKSATDAATDLPYFLVVEKILNSGERLPRWPIHGTTGYEFLNMVSGLLLDRAGVDAIAENYALLTAGPRRFSEVVHESKKLVLRVAMSAELTVLARKLDRISEQDRATRDFTLISLKDALAELIACFPVYRTYVRPEDGSIADDDRRHIQQAIDCACQHNPTTNNSIFDFIRSLLLLESPHGLSEAEQDERSNFVRRFQQLTGPVMAKGLEDTAAYRYFPLAVQNEVGGNPGRPPCSVEDFHRFNAQRLIDFPHGLSTTATHDTKRGEDVRARLAVLSECPESWRDAVVRWRTKNACHRVIISEAEVPDANEEYLLYQTLIGAWPIGGLAAEPSFVNRIELYMEKALREAKLHTSWIKPSAEYEKAVRHFIGAILDPSRSESFLADFERFQGRIALPGFWNSLSQVVVKVASPGVPDFYQGAELWDLSLVDPDNRRPVDFTLRRSLLSELGGSAAGQAAALAEQLMLCPEDGRVKLYTTAKALAFRRHHHELFAKGAYLPIEVSGEQREYVVAFARVLGDRAVLAVVGRLYMRLGSKCRLPIGKAVWQDTSLHLPEALARFRFHEALTDRVLLATGATGRRSLEVGAVLQHLPVALLGGAA